MRRTHLAAVVAVIGASLGVPAARAQDVPDPHFAIALLPPTTPVPGRAMTWTVLANVDAERFTVRLARHSSDLRLLHRRSSPDWQIVHGAPQWSFGPLDPATETDERVRFRTAVARDAAVGSRVCIGIRAAGVNGSGAAARRESTGIDRLCAKVRSRP